MVMENDKSFFTVTMARVLADQGKYEAAARIYRYLLDQTPDRSDLKEALAAVSSMLPDRPGQWHEISDSIERWVRLMLKHNALRRLQRHRIQKK